MIKTIFIVICIIALLFDCLYYIKTLITYKNLLPKDTYVLIEPFIEKG